MKNKGNILRLTINIMLLAVMMMAIPPLVSADSGLPTPTSASIKLDSVQNPVMKDPSDFEIGKAGTKEFNISIEAKPAKSGEATNRALGIIIPKGFSILGTPSVSFENAGDTEDGKGTLWIHRYDDSGDYPLTELTMTINQNAEYLLKNLTAGDSYDFIVNNYYNYGVENETIDSSATLSLVPNSNDVITNITVSTDTVTAIPSMLGNIQQGFTRDLEIKNDFAKNFIKNFVVTIKKEKGHIPTDLTITLPTDFAPGLGGNNVFNYFAVATIYLDSTENQPYLQELYGYDLKYHPNIYVTDILSYATTWRTRSGETDTLVDELYNATEIILSFPVLCYPNRLDFTIPATTYTSTSNAQYSYTDYSIDKNVHTDSIGPLNIKAENGTDTSATLIHLKIDKENNNSSLSEQQMDTSRTLHEVVFFSNEDDYAIIDNAKMVYEFEEAYSPVAFPFLLTNEDNDLTYTITITDTKTNTTRTIIRNPGEERTLTGEELALGTTEYVSSVMVTSPRLYHNVSKTSFFGYSPVFSAEYQALSKSLDGNTTYDDGDGTYVAHMKATVTGDNIETPIESPYQIKLIKSQDNPYVYASNSSSYTAIVNEHNRSICIGSYWVRKYKDTMEYGKNGDKMPEVVVSGDGVGLVDRVSTEDQKLVAYQDNNGTWHDVSEIADNYIITDEMYDERGQNKLTELYDLKAIIDATANGGDYAQAIKLSLDGINDWSVGNVGYTTRNFYLGASKVCPGYLNYNELFGGTGADNLPGGPFRLEADLDCNWSGESEDVQNVQDLKHVSATANGQSVVFINGNYVTAANWEPLDFFFMPAQCSSIVRYNENERMGSLGELTTTQVIARQKTMNYHNAYIDFAGTDPDLLALTEYIRIQRKSHTNVFRDYSIGVEKLTVEYTTKAGNTGSEDFSCGPMANLLYASIDLRSLLADENDYFTSLKVLLPEEVAYTWLSSSCEDQAFPDVSLGRDSTLPLNYPVSGDALGTKTNVDNEGNEYDRLPTKATVYAEDLFGNEVTNIVTEGYSCKLKMPTMYLNAFYMPDPPKYNSSVIYQGEATTFKVELGIGTDDTGSIDPDKNFSPVFYLKVDKDFFYNGTARLTTEKNSTYYAYNQTALGDSIKFIEAGTGENQSGSADFGYVIFDMGKLNEDMVRSVRPAWPNLELELGLRSKNDATIGTDRVPVSGVWMDIPYDRNQANSPDREYLVDTINTVPGAPYGDVFENTPGTTDSPAKLDEDGNALMFYQEITKTMTVNKAIVIGIADIAKAEKPLAYGSTVTSKDYAAVENLFDANVFITGSESVDTSEWVLYFPVPQKGGESTLLNKKYTNDYGMDLISIDTTELDAALTAAGEQKCTVEYTTNTTPSIQGATGGTDPAGEYSASVTDMNAVTMVRVSIPNLPMNTKAYVYLNFKLEEDKTEAGTQHAYFNPTGNAKKAGELLIEKGFAPNPILDYVLEDFIITGNVWNESDGNSLKDKSDTNVAGVTMKLFKDSTEIAQNTGSLKGKNENITNNLGNYTLYAPTEGDYEVKATLPSGKKMVLQFVTTGVQTTHNANESWFDRDNNTANVNVSADKTKDINAGIYNVPVITVDDVSFHVTSEDNEITASVVNQPTGKIVAISLETGAPGDIVTLTDQQDGTASVDAEKVGTVKGVASIEDGYGGTVTAEFDISVYADVKYNVNAGTGSVPTDAKHYELNDEVTVKPATSDMAKNGYTFTGWNTKADGSGTAYAANAKFNMGEVTDDVTLYAQWRENVKIGGDITDDLNVTKTLTGANPPSAKNETFEFELYDITAPTGVTAPTCSSSSIFISTATGTDDATHKYGLSTTSSKSIAFGIIELKEPGEYTLKVREKAGTNTTNYTYDDTIYTLTVAVEANADNTALTASVSGGPLSFSNAYSAAQSDDYQIPKVTKTVQGDNPDDKTFNFEIEGSEGAPMPAATTQSVTGSGEADFGKIKFTAAGTYTYTITETAGSDTGYCYDPSIYTVEVTVEDSNGKLSVTSTTTTYGRTEVSDDNDEVVIEAVEERTTATSVSFTNVYSPKWTSKDDMIAVDPPVVKIVKGNPAKNETFKFTLTAGDINNPMPEGSANGQKSLEIVGEGEGEFGTWVYKKAGTYTYTVSEENTGVKDYTYDTTLYTIEDVVMDVNGQLTLERTVTNLNEDVVDECEFTNAYTGTSTPPTPKTGDRLNICLWAVLMFSSALMLIIGVKRKKEAN